MYGIDSKTFTVVVPGGFSVKFICSTYSNLILKKALSTIKLISGRDCAGLHRRPTEQFSFLVHGN